MRIKKIILTIICLCLFGIGVCASQIYNYYYPVTIEKVVEECSTQAKISGLWLPDIKDLENYNGKYICINLDETTNLKELQRICEHEIGHEIFARVCEKDIDKCLDLTE